MLKRDLPISVLVIGVILLLGSVMFFNDSIITAAPLTQSGTATPEQEEETSAAGETPAPEDAAVTPNGSEPALSQLATQVADLQTQVTKLESAIAALSGPSVEQANQVNTAIYLLDNAGLHDLDVRLNEEGIIEADDSGRVGQIARLLSTVDWPQSIAANGEALLATLTDLSAALADDDIEMAAPLAAQAHEEQHALSHAVEHWLEGVEVHASENEYGQAHRVNTAIYLLDNAGLHDLDVRLNEEDVIEPDDSGRVAQIARLLLTVDWPEPLAADGEALLATLTDLSAALADDDVDTAAPLATQAHDVQHALSHAAEHWLEGVTDPEAHGDAGEGHEDDGQQFTEEHEETSEAEHDEGSEAEHSEAESD